MVPSIAWAAGVDSSAQAARAGANILGWRMVLGFLVAMRLPEGRSAQGPASM